MTLQTHLAPVTLPVLLVSLSLVQPSLTLAQATTSQDLTNHISNQAAANIHSSLLENTGDQTTVQSSTQNTTKANQTTENTAYSKQTVNAEANTGYNEASRNISIGGNAGVITTGNAGVITDIITAANSSANQITPYTSSPVQTTTTTNTGDSTTHQTTAHEKNSAFIKGKNNAVIYQSTNAQAQTGNNVADRNISLGGNAGVITTGNAGVTTNYLVAANSGVALIGGDSNSGGPGSGASIVALNTGDNTRYTPSSSRLTQSAITNHNSAHLTQTCGGSYSYSSDGVCSAITGGNTANRNISRNGDAGIIQTGNAVVVLNLLASANDTSAVLQNKTNSASLNSDTVNTGNNVHVAADQNDSSSSSSSVFQHAVADQSVNAVADTGRNTANRNISFGGDAGVITTGHALINLKLSALANTTESYLNSDWPK